MKKLVLLFIAVCSVAFTETPSFNPETNSFFYVAAESSLYYPKLSGGYRTKYKHIGGDLSSSAYMSYNGHLFRSVTLDILALYYPVKESGFYLGAGTGLVALNERMNFSGYIIPVRGVFWSHTLQGALGYEFRTEIGKTRFVQLTTTTNNNFGLQAGFGF